MTEKHVLFDMKQGLYVGSHSITTKTHKFGEFVIPPHVQLQERERAYEFTCLTQATTTKHFLETQVAPMLKLTIITEKTKDEEKDEV
jgi:hypothetical protein